MENIEEERMNVDEDSVVQEWTRLFNEGSISKGTFRSYWREMVPVIYSPSLNCDCLNMSYDEEKAKKYLFDVLEKFLCNGDPVTVFQELKNLDNPPMLCGKVFKSGEPTYSCRDCGMDPTCVLCVDCFKTSGHRHHRYKMSTSGGGGYCDCGDTEAWKESPSCERHLQAGQEGSEEASIDRMPKDIVARTTLVLNVVLDYCYQLLTWERATDLPLDLKNKDILARDTYTTMLFNDEIHTYDQVIHTLTRAIECQQKEAIDQATTIDREGRSIVKCAPFKQCDAVKATIEKLTSRHGAKPLKVLVMHTSIIAHQVFAVRLLSWIQQLITVSDGMRQLFSYNVTKSSGVDGCILEGVLQTDTQLWKSARTQWHQLMISGLLMDQESKKAFSRLFTKNYPCIMKDFIADDHEHSLSVSSLSVQIFTVPTLAHMLIMEENALAILTQTFLFECEQRLNAERKLVFQRNQISNSFKRSQYILFDIKYILNSRPEQWNNQLRKHFLHGFSLLLTLLGHLQGMDNNVRQVGQHMEFEPEWENAFNLLMRLTPVITLLIEWCGADRIVLIKAFRAALKSLEATQGTMKVIGRELANHSASCIDYDVASQSVSLHLPLSRLVAGLYLILEKFDLSFDSHEFSIKNKPTPEQLIELPLRTQVMIAQVHAGMWRRNGYSLLHQIFCYQAARFRNEMLDRDIILLQTGATLIESNEYLLHLLNKFGLVSWAREEYETDYLKLEEDSVRQTITLVEEFLGLLLIIVGERYLPGVGQVTEEDMIKKEIVQQLCIERMAHSQLSKALSEDHNHETGMETVIDQVAIFKKPQDTGKGMYELKPEFLKDYNPFFYHYTREEQSKAEECQRKRKKQAGEEECCPPPVPPPLCTSFSMLVNILQCDIMLHIMRVVLERCGNLRARSFSETQFQKILHLIGYALHEEQRYHENNDPLFNFTSKATPRDIFSLLESLVGSQRIDTHKDLLNWTLRKYRQVQQLHVEDGDSVPMETSSLEKEADDARSAEALKEEKKRRAEIAAARRARIMAHMSTMQKNFIREHADLFEKTKVETSPSFGSAMDLSDTPVEEMPVCLGPQQTTQHLPSQRHTCILCQEDEDVSAQGRAMVLASFIQKSTVLSKNRGRLLKNPDEYDPLIMPSDLFCAPHTSTCSHVMHADCWNKYFESVLAKERRRPLRYSLHLSFDIDRREFLCPLCECLSNTVLPLIPSAVLTAASSKPPVDLSLDDTLKGLEIALKLVSQPKNHDHGEMVNEKFEPISILAVCQELEEPCRINFQQIFNYHPVDTQIAFSKRLIEMIQIFAQATYTTGLGVLQHQENKRIPLMVWWSCAYTIQAIEGLLRDQGKPLFGELSTRQADCLSALIRISTTCGLVATLDVLQRHCTKLLGLLFHCNALNTDSECDSALPGILEIDAFSSMVSLCFLLPYLFCPKESSTTVAVPSGNVRDQHIFTILYTMHIIQLLLTATDLPDPSTSMDTGDSASQEMSDEEASLRRLYLFVREHARNQAPNIQAPTPYQHLQYIQQSSVPFLRCCAIFFHYLTGVPPPPALRDPSVAEYKPLAKYLNLPSFSSLWESKQLRALVKRWIQHHVLVSRVRPQRMKFPLTVNQLVPLPHDYSELINDASMFTCPNSDGDDSRTPTLCLVCGEMLCSQSYCCQTELDNMLVGACTNHAYYCGAGVGLFLRVRECKILLLTGKTRGCFILPPYLDEYGETDMGLKRGNPLHLCVDHYKKLHTLWLSHGIPEEVTRSLETNGSNLSNEWHHV